MLIVKQIFEASQGDGRFYQDAPQRLGSSIDMPSWEQFEEAKHTLGEGDYAVFEASDKEVEEGVTEGYTYRGKVHVGKTPKPKVSDLTK